MPEKQTAQLYVEVEFDPAVTDAESLATTMDRLMETALSTPDILGDYGNPAVKDFYAVGKQSTRYVTSIEVVDPDSQAPVAVEVRKTQGGYLVGIDGSYLEQDIGPVYDPCNFGVELEVSDDEEEGRNDGIAANLVESAERLGLDAEQLDELVHEQYSQIASAINNEGARFATGLPRRSSGGQSCGRRTSCIGEGRMISLGREVSDEDVTIVVKRHGNYELQMADRALELCRQAHAARIARAARPTMRSMSRQLRP